MKLKGVSIWGRTGAPFMVAAESSTSVGLAHFLFWCHSLSCRLHPPSSNRAEERGGKESVTGAKGERVSRVGKQLPHTILKSEPSFTLLLPGVATGKLKHTHFPTITP